jgi:hypothetical protein
MKKALAWMIVLVMGGFALYYLGWFGKELYFNLGLISAGVQTFVKCLGYLALIFLYLGGLMLVLGLIYGLGRWAVATLQDLPL